MPGARNAGPARKSPGVAARDELIGLGASPRDATALALRLVFVAIAEALGRPVSRTTDASSVDLSSDDLARLIEPIASAPGLAATDLGAAYELMKPGDDRRRLGAHYTSSALARRVVEGALAPLLSERATSESILSLAILDPAMGSGAFLMAACEVLAERLHEASQHERPTLFTTVRDLAHARARVASTCLFGVDKDPLAVESARLSLWLVAGGDTDPADFGKGSLVVGDALVGLSPFELDGRVSELLDLLAGSAPAQRHALADFALDAWRSGKSPVARRDLLDRALSEIRSHARRGATGDLALRSSPVRERHTSLHWPLVWPHLWRGARAGFDAVVGNPPWVSFVGRAAQPLPPADRSFLAPSPAFFGYRNLQGVFIHRAATLLRPGGRLGLIVPTSMSDLAGYAPSRAAHDALAECDPCLPDFGGGGFEGIFQPCMGLLSTRRAAAVADLPERPWPLSRTHLGDVDVAIVDALDRLPRLPATLFGERGYQTAKTDRAGFVRADEATPPFEVALRVGGDVRPFARRPPRLFCDPKRLVGRLRDRAEWQRVAVLIRQTARFPMAALSDGGAFRNSVLAGLAVAPYDAFFLVAYLNSSPVRHYHYMKHRDARQGMPQLKISHLRALPAPPGEAVIEAIAGLGRTWGRRNTGITREEQELLDATVGSGLGLDEQARASIARWAANTAL